MSFSLEKSETNLNGDHYHKWLPNASGKREAICDSSDCCKGNFTDPPKILSSASKETE